MNGLFSCIRVRLNAQIFCLGAGFARALILFVLSAFTATPSLFAAEVEEVRLWRAPDYTRIVFDLDQQVQYSVFIWKILTVSLST